MRHASAASRAFGLAQLRDAFTNGRIGVLMLLNFLNLFAFSCFEAMFTRFGLARFPAKFGLDRPIEKASLDQVLGAAPYAGYYLFAIGIISAVIQGGLIRRLVPKFGETKLAIAGPLILGLALALIGFAGGVQNWGLVITGCLVMPLGFGLTNPSVTGLISRASPHDKQGAYLGMSQSAASLARVIGPPVAGVFFAMGPSRPFFASAAVSPSRARSPSRTGVATYTFTDADSGRGAAVVLSEPRVNAAAQSVQEALRRPASVSAAPANNYGLRIRSFETPDGGFVAERRAQLRPRRRSWLNGGSPARCSTATATGARRST